MTTGEVHGYDRTAVDHYLQVAAAEQERLRAEIAEARDRIARARAVAVARRLLSTMVLDACDEIGAVRRSAEVAVSWRAPQPEGGRSGSVAATSEVPELATLVDTDREAFGSSAAVAS